MNTLEDTLRTALDETGAEITPQSVPPLRLHDGWRRPGRPGIGSRRRWPAWLAPLAAAAAVAVVIATPLAISASFHDRARQPLGAVPCWRRFARPSHSVYSTGSAVPRTTARSFSPHSVGGPSAWAVPPRSATTPRR